MNSLLDRLIPTPRAVAVGGGCVKRPRRLALTVGPAARERGFLNLAGAVLRPWVNGPAGPSAAVDARIEPRLRSPDLRRLPEELAAEYYELTIGRSISLVAPAYAGLQRGIQTLRQILEESGDQGELPRLRIQDWPRVATRGIHLDLAREMEYRPAHLRRVVELLAYLKFNTLHLYLENKFAYPSAPEVAPPGVMTPAQARALCRHAQTFGITIIPQVSTMGHMEHLLIGPYAELREEPESPINICPSHPRTRPFLAGLIADVAAAFRPPFIHVGYDESHTGFCPRCARTGPPHRILTRHLAWLDGEVKRHGARTMIYGDMFLAKDDFPRADAANGGPPAQAREALRNVGRDILITDWHYTAPYGGTTEYLVRKGFEVQMVSATNNYWHDSIALHRDHHWVVETLDRAIRTGASGVIHSNWDYRHGQFFDNYWFFQGLAAERGWTDSPHDYAAWGRRFARRFWGVDVDYYSELAGLAECILTLRCRAFLDCHALELEIKGSLTPVWPDVNQMVNDYSETGQYLIDQAGAFRRAARRNADTLRMLDMPGQIIRYIGRRALMRQRLEAAFRRGDRRAALRALAEGKAAAHAVALRLREGHRIRGGAVEDRGRIARHLEQLASAARVLRGADARTLRAMSVERLMNVASP